MSFYSKVGSGDAGFDFIFIFFSALLTFSTMSTRVLLFLLVIMRAYWSYSRKFSTCCSSLLLELVRSLEVLADLRRAVLLAAIIFSK
jgi:hypothetical protein